MQACFGEAGAARQCPTDVHGLLPLGGAMGANDDDVAPWLADERALLADAVERGMPVLGLCLGGQLLAAATGGRVELGPTQEIGLAYVRRTVDGLTDPVMSQAVPSPGNEIPAAQWHQDHVAELPDGAVLLLTNDACRVQAFRVGDTAYGLQLHPELDAATFRSWADYPDEALGRSGIDPLVVADDVDAAEGDLIAAWRPVTRAWGDLVWAAPARLMSTPAQLRHRPPHPAGLPGSREGASTVRCRRGSSRCWRARTPRATCSWTSGCPPTPTRRSSCSCASWRRATSPPGGGWSRRCRPTPTCVVASSRSSACPRRSATSSRAITREWEVLADAEALTVAPSARQMRHDLLVAVGAEPASPDPVASGAQEAVLDRLRIAYRRALLGIAARDLSGLATMDTVAQWLSDLADCVLDAALADRPCRGRRRGRRSAASP